MDGVARVQGAGRVMDSGLVYPRQFVALEIGQVIGIGSAADHDRQIARIAESCNGILQLKLFKRRTRHCKNNASWGGGLTIGQEEIVCYFSSFSAAELMQ